jgi:hypothetical protein
VGEGISSNAIREENMKNGNRKWRKYQRKRNEKGKN